MSEEERPEENTTPIVVNEEEAPRYTTPPEVAGGLKAVISSLQHTQKEMGIFSGMKTLLKMNQLEGLDCPGCAWPDPAHRSAAEFCENGAKAVVDEATSKRVEPHFFAEHTIGELRKKSGRWLNAQGRITTPMILKEGSQNYEPLSWEAAFELIADELASLESPDEAVFYTSGRTSNEAAFLYQLFVRIFGTNNLPDCSNLCHESSGVGLTETIGIGKGTVLLEDFSKADAIFIFGQNPGTNHPRMMTALQEAARAGTKIVAVNPLREPGLTRFKHPQEISGIIGKGTDLATLYLQVKPNGDVALLKGIMKEMLEQEAANPGKIFDQKFIEERTAGFEAFKEDLEKTDWEEILAHSGLTREEIRAAAAIEIESKATIACWAMGLTQHKNGVANVQEVVNFLLLRGQIGKPGAGACPVRGHSNVQGDRTMGIWERPSKEFLDRLEESFDFQAPRSHGYDVVHAIEAMEQKKVGVFVALGGNFLSAAPDTNYTARALQSCGLTVQISTKLNRSHLYGGRRALILPCLARTELDEGEKGPQFVSVENSMGIVHRSQGHLPPASRALMSEPAIIAALAAATFPRLKRQTPPVPWLRWARDYDQIRDAIAATIPGFEFFNRRVRKPGGFLLPNGPREGTFTTPSGKAHFSVHAIPHHSLKKGELMMMTIRSHDQFNTTVYTDNDRYRGIKSGRRVVLLHRDELETLGLKEGQKVDLKSTYSGETRVAPDFAVLPYNIPRGTAATYFPETNVLIPLEEKAHRSHTPASKSIIITLHPR